MTFIRHAPVTVSTLSWFFEPTSDAYMRSKEMPSRFLATPGFAVSVLVGQPRIQDCFW